MKHTFFIFGILFAVVLPCLCVREFLASRPTPEYECTLWRDSGLSIIGNVERGDSVGFELTPGTNTILQMCRRQYSHREPFEWLFPRWRMSCGGFTDYVFVRLDDSISKDKPIRASTWENSIVVVRSGAWGGLCRIDDSAPGEVEVTFRKITPNSARVNVDASVSYFAYTYDWEQRKWENNRRGSENWSNTFKAKCAVKTFGREIRRRDDRAFFFVHLTPLSADATPSYVVNQTVAGSDIAALRDSLIRQRPPILPPYDYVLFSSDRMLPPEHFDALNALFREQNLFFPTFLLPVSGVTERLYPDWVNWVEETEMPEQP